MLNKVVQSILAALSLALDLHGRNQQRRWWRGGGKPTVLSDLLVTKPVRPMDLACLWMKDLRSACEQASRGAGEGQQDWEHGPKVDA